MGGNVGLPVATSDNDNCSFYNGDKFLLSRIIHPAFKKKPFTFSDARVYVRGKKKGYEK